MAGGLQLVTTGCWLTLKEVALLLGTLARTVPLSSATLASQLAAAPHTPCGMHVHLSCSAFGELKEGKAKSMHGTVTLQLVKPVLANSVYLCVCTIRNLPIDSLEVGLVTRRLASWCKAEQVVNLAMCFLPA